MDIYIILRNGEPVGPAYKEKQIAESRVKRYNLEENDSIFVKYKLKAMHVI